MQRRGKWIWRDRGTRGPEVRPSEDANLFVLFRRTFSLEAPPASAPVRVSADGRYRVFVNGTYVGRGPARCEPLFQYYDEYDIAPLLRPGENVVAAVVHSYGRDMSWYELARTHWSRTLGCAGFWFECDGVDGIDSDSRWRYRVSEAWESDSAPGSVGFAEIYDARRADIGWLEPAFDDREWADASVLVAPGFGHAPDVVPFPNMVPRDIPHLIEEPRNAARVLSVAEVEATGDMLALAEASPLRLSSCSASEPDAMLVASDPATTLSFAAGRALTVVLDFGRDVSGYPRFDVEGVAGTTIDISYGERLRDDGRCPVQRPNPVTGQNVHRYILRDGRQAWEKSERAGFRYLQLTVAAPDGVDATTLRLHHVGVNFTSYPVDPAGGSFECSDDAITRIWQAGRYTLQLCMQDGFEDCPSREQRQWVGDARIESLVSYAAMADARLTAKSIRQTAQSQMRDGMTQMATPGDISARWPLYIVDYCLAWITTIGEYVLHTGDDAIIDDVFPSVVGAVAWFERHIGDDGLLVNAPGWIFIDWAEVDRRGACTVLNALLVEALGHAATMARRQSATQLAEPWTATSARIAAALNEKLWDADRGVYVDAFVDGQRCRRVSQHANAAMIAAGIAPRERRDSMLDYIMDPARLVETSTGFGTQDSVPIDEERQVVLAQPFFTYYVHRALVATGRTPQMVDNIRHRWSPMLAVDGTDTMWEHWHGRESRCHAWSATPVFDLTREVLGVRPVTPGYARARIEPSLSGLQWAGGRCPTPHGNISVDWRIGSGVFKLALDIPPGVEAELRMPNGEEAELPPGTYSMECLLSLVP